MSNLKKIQLVADAMNAGIEPTGVLIYRLGTASPNPNRNEEHQVFTNTKNPRQIGAVGKVGGAGAFVPFEHLEDGRPICSL